MTGAKGGAEPLSRRARLLLWDLHAWTGVLSGLVLFVLFFCGAFALFMDEIAVWQDPDRVAAVGLADVERLAWAHGGERGFTIPASGEGHLHMYTEVAPLQWDEQMLDPATGTLGPPRSDLAHFLYDLHFLEPIPGGQQIAGGFAVLLLLTVTTGLLVHLRDLPAHALRLRARAAASIRWADAHKLLGTIGLPFLVLVAWTGALMCLLPTILPAYVPAVFGGDDLAALRAVGVEGWPEPPPAAGRPGTVLPFDVLAARAAEALPGLDPVWVETAHLRDEAATVTLFGKLDGGPFDLGEAMLRASDGAVLQTITLPTMPPAARLLYVSRIVHYAQYGGLAVRALYAALALASCGLFVSGVAVWLSRRRGGRADTVLLRLTVGVCAGLVAATGTLFLANRALPMDLGERPAWEIGVFCVAWAGALIHALASPSALRALLRAAGVAFVLAGVADLAAPARLGLPFVAAVDIGLVVLGAGALAVSARFSRAVLPFPPASSLQPPASGLA